MTVAAAPRRSQNLVRYDAACRALAEAKAVDEVKAIRDKAEALRHYARQARNRNLEVDAAEIRFRAERRLGEMIRAQKETVGLHEGGRPSKTPAAREGVSRVTLNQIGVDYKLSQRAQKLATVPAAKFEGMLGEWRETVQRESEKVTTRLLKAGEIAEGRKDYEARKESGGTVADLVALAASGKRFGVIYCDPPWTFEVYSGKGKQRSAERHYDTLSLEAIQALPVEALAADDCALLLWACWPTMPEALAVIESWGFRFSTAGFVWVKQNRSGDGLFTGMGYSTRANTESCLLATRGRPARLALDVHQVILAPVGEHSRKPLEARQRIERLYAGPYLEMFARERVDGWTVWGDEVAPVLAESVA